MGNIRQKEIIVLHEYGAKNHYTALEYYCEKKNFNLIYREFGIIPQIKKIIKKRNFKDVKRLVINIVFLTCEFLRITNKKNRKIILGIAPLDKRLNYLANIFKFDDIYIHNSWPNWVNDRFPKKWSKKNQRIWTEAIKNKIRGCYAVSNATKEGVMNYFNCSEDYPISIVYHSINEEWFTNQQVKVKKNYSNDLLFIGRLTAEKGTDSIIMLSELCKNKTFHIIGEGPEQYKFEGRNNIVTYGYLGDIKKIVSIADKCSYVLMPSFETKDWQEAFGLSLIEAMSRGVVPIATFQPGPIEIINNNQGYLFDSKTYVSNACKILNNSSNENKIVWELKSSACKERSHSFRKFKLAEKWGELINA